VEENFVTKSPDEKKAGNGSPAFTPQGLKNVQRRGRKKPLAEISAKPSPLGYQLSPLDLANLS
jgi:hypothetical protein